MTLPFRFPLYELGVAGPEETKNLARKILRLIQIRWATPSVEKISDIGKVNCRVDPYTTGFCLGAAQSPGPARSKKCFGYGIGERLASASQHEIPIRFPK